MPPNPRNAEVGGLFVYAVFAEMRALSTRYGPHACTLEYSNTSAERYAYAPASERISTSWARIVPSFLAAVRYRIVLRCRFARARSDSFRVHCMRTGLRVVHAASATYGSTVMSSLPPKPPPTYGAITRTLESGTPSIFAMSR